jgi:ABC-type nitrate/sulfonate/bicarbonate transport system substrate-binding protein
MACLILAACSSGVHNRPVRTLRFADFINIDTRDVPMMMAFDALEAQGYRIVKTYHGNATLIADLLIRGETDIGLTNNHTMWAAILKGADVRTIAEFTAPTIVVAAGPEVRTCGDLDGRRVGVASTTGLNPELFKWYLARNCGGARPQLLVLLESAARSAALVAGAVDAIVVPGEELVKMQQHGHRGLHALVSYKKQFPRIHMDGLHVRRDWARTHVDVISDFLRELLRAQRRVLADPQVLYDESMRRLSLDYATAKAVGDFHLGLRIWDADGALTAEGVQDTLDLLATIGALPAGVKANDVADLSYLEGVVRAEGHKTSSGSAAR